MLSDFVTTPTPYFLKEERKWEKKERGEIKDTIRVKRERFGPEAYLEGKKKRRATHESKL